MIYGLIALKSTARLTVKIIARVNIVSTALQTKPLHQCARYQQCAINTEVLTRHQLLGICLFLDGIKKQRVNLMHHQPVPVFGKVQWFQTISSMPKPTNQRNIRS